MTPPVRAALDISHLRLRPIVESALRAMLAASPVPLDDDVIAALAASLERRLGGTDRIT